MNVNTLISKLIDKVNVYAVVGASRNPEKYGYRVYKDLKEAGYRVYAVNPNAQEILGDKCYPSLEALPEKPTVVVTVVPPKVTEKIVEQCRDIGVKMVWMQPGSESEKAVKFCEENGIDVVYNVCIMIERRSPDL